jgi:hypothetical protein
MTEKNTGLNNAKKGKQDEFYTQLTDIEKELKHYKEYLKGKVVFCNCDDPQESDFWKYFSLNFDKLKLKKLISTHYVTSGQSYKLEMRKGGEQSLPLPLYENGDFRSQECIELLKEADIIVTNPPFSLFREYVNQLIEYNKSFIIIGNMNIIGCKEIFPLLEKDKMWLGCSIHSGDREFRVPDYYPLNAAGVRVDKDGTKYIRIKGVRWFTNLDIKERHEDLVLYKHYDEKEYPKYDNYNAINVDKTKDIPFDYDGEIGVPITFMDKYNPDQFEIVGIARALVKKTTGKVSQFRLNGKELYFRIVIKKRVK